MTVDLQKTVPSHPSQGRPRPPWVHRQWMVSMPCGAVMVTRMLSRRLARLERIGPKDRVRFVRLFKFFVLLGLLFSTADPSVAQDIRLEAENFIDSQDNGLESIVIVPCDLASGGLAVDGVDATGDRIVLDLPLDTRFCFQSGIRSAGDITLVRVFEVSFNSVPDDSYLFADTLTTVPGSGVG